MAFSGLAVADLRRRAPSYQPSDLRPGLRPGCQPLACGLQDAEFDIPGQIVADITVVAGPDRASDGSTTLNLEALTVAE